MENKEIIHKLRNALTPIQGAVNIFLEIKEFDLELVLSVQSGTDRIMKFIETLEKEEELK